jgi:hypothetical protein
MATTFQKLNLKDQREILVLNAPKSFEHELDQLTGVTIKRDLSSVTQVEFALAFVTLQTEVDGIATQLVVHCEGDAIVWFAYPKQTSKRFRCDFNRDTGWDILRSAGFDTVRAVAIDDDWSALRFRRVEFIKNSARR